MDILINEGKAKWVDGDESGRWQEIKTNDKGSFIRKGVEIIYLEANTPPLIKPSKEPAPTKKADEHELKIFYAYWETKPTWDKIYGKNASSDYYYYRGLCLGMPKSFFNKQKIK